MGGQSQQRISCLAADMEAEELPIVATETTVVKKAIVKKSTTLARTPMTAAKKKGIGLFAVKTFSADLASIVGKTKGTRADATKGVWSYIKKKGLNKGKMISADATLKKVFGGGSMFKLAGAMTKHIK